MTDRRAAVMAGAIGVAVVAAGTIWVLANDVGDSSELAERTAATASPPAAGGEPGAKKPDEPIEAPEPEEILPPDAPRVDVAFCLDATGSMAGVIDRARAKVEEIAGWVRRGTPKPRVRFGLVVYRDRGDREALKSYGFLPSPRAVRAALAGVSAEGGGDIPEDVVGGLRAAVTALDWDPAAAVKMVFLIGDAEPHLDYGADSDDKPVLEAARAKGIRIGTIACGGMTAGGHAFWKKVAEATGGAYQWLPGTSGTPVVAEMELEEAVFTAVRAEATKAGIVYP